eukprot:COSAG06_NODE_66922_length_253_cov_0.668831_1_plen_51_part_10
MARVAVVLTHLAPWCGLDAVRTKSSAMPKNSRIDGFFVMLDTRQRHSSPSP